MSFHIKITPRESLAPVRPLIAVRITPKRPAGPALSPLAQDESSHRPLTKAEAAEETRAAYAIIEERLAHLGIARSNVRVSHSRRFKARMGDARTLSYDPANPTGVIRFSTSPLWRRATPAKRRNTIIHELAHILADCEARRRAGHGKVWQRKMIALGEKPERCHAVNRDGLRRRGSRSPRVVNADANIFDFRPGDRVTFHARGRDVMGKVAAYGRKRLSIIEDGQTRPTWRVPPALLRKVSP
jgi:hypothetical protein